jgi:hypothetical protein
MASSLDTDVLAMGKLSGKALKEHTFKVNGMEKALLRLKDPVQDPLGFAHADDEQLQDLTFSSSYAYLTL